MEAAASKTLSSPRHTSPLFPIRQYRVHAPINWGIKVVPENKAFVIERFGKYNKTLTPGFHILIPIIDRIAYVHSLREEPVYIFDKSAVTKDKIHVVIYAVIYTKIFDPILASYAVYNLEDAVTKLAERTVCRLVGTIALNELDNLEDMKVFEEKILMAIKGATKDWGLTCVGCEIEDISPRDGIEAAKKMMRSGNFLDAVIEVLKREFRLFVSSCGGFIAAGFFYYTKKKNDQFQEKIEKFHVASAKDLAACREDLRILVERNT